MSLQLYHAMLTEQRKKGAELLAQLAQGIYLPDEKFKSKFTPKEKRELIATWLKYFPNMSIINTKEVGRLAGSFHIGFDFVTDNLAGAGLKPTTIYCQYM